MLQLYLLNCSPLLQQPLLERAIALLPAQRREKVQRIRIAEKKAQSAAAGLLLQHLFGAEKLSFGLNGKPFLSHTLDRYFNISHSGQYVVCAVSDQDVGVDVEINSLIRASVMRRCFTPTEQEWIQNDSKKFARLWTMKEAYMKLLGTGLSLPPLDIHLSMPPQSGFDAAHNCYWQFPEWDVPISLCSISDEPAEIIRLEIKDLL